MTVAPTASPIEEETNVDHTEPAQYEQNEIKGLLGQLKAKDPNERANAIASLSTGTEGDVAVHTALVEAMSDQDANVRTQALNALTRVEGADGAQAEIQQAMNDDDTSVRLAAVDSMGNNVELLKLALKDSDQTIRQLAEVRIKEINNKRSGK